MKVTLPETNISPENGWLEYYFPLGAPAYFQGLLLLVLGRVPQVTDSIRICIRNRKVDKGI